MASLASWLQATHSTLCKEATLPKDSRSCVLLTAEPAQGKTCLMSQLVTLIIKDERNPLVPILVRVHQLQAHLLNVRHRNAASNPFAHAWNFVDAHLQVGALPST